MGRAIILHGQCARPLWPTGYAPWPTYENFLDEVGNKISQKKIFFGRFFFGNLFSFCFSKNDAFSSVFEFVRNVPVCSSCGFVVAGDEDWDAPEKFSCGEKIFFGAYEKTRHPPKKNTPRDMANLSVGQGARKTTPDISRMRVFMYATLKNFVTSFFTTCEAVKPPTSGKSLSELQKDNTKAARHPFSPPSEREVRSRDQPLSGPSRLSTERERGVRDFFCLLKCVL